MKAICAALIVALMAGPALAQQQKTPGPPPAAPKSQTEIQAERAAERAYQKSLGNIPDQGPADPWGGVRSDNSPKTIAKSAKPKPKPKSTEN